MKFLVILMIGLLSACGKNITESENKKPTTKLFEDQIIEEINGIYRAELMPVNPVIEDGFVGSSTVARERDEFVVDVTFSLGTPNVFHPQNIHLGNRCPTIADDLNGDGYIDIQEALRVVGDILIPIDEDISSQWMGLGTYPMTDDFGSFFWSKATSFSKLLADFYEEDINFDDGIAKLKPTELLSLDGKIILILGASTNQELPDTVLGHKRMNSHAALPIACGRYEKILNAPGRIDQDGPIQINN